MGRLKSRDVSGNIPILPDYFLNFQEYLASDYPLTIALSSWYANQRQ
jgi:hypothetical protein